MITSHPFDLLAQLEKRVKHAALYFPEQESATTYWAGVTFHINEQRFVVDSREISEVLPVPNITPLPDVQQWVNGIANIRGRIIPIFDLGAFLGRKKQSVTENNRVMLVERKNIALGIVVDAVQGMIQFSSIHDEKNIPENLDLAIRPFITGCYYKDVHHMVFSTERLVNNPRFIKAAKHS